MYSILRVASHFLHSFPTRRSSDLFYRQVGQVPPKRHTQFRDDAGNLYFEELMGEEGFSSDSSLLYHRGVPRSEEHTSELQSRGHIVCRLLLEKKNIIEQKVYTLS